LQHPRGGNGAIESQLAVCLLDYLPKDAEVLMQCVRIVRRHHAPHSQLRCTDGDFATAKYSARPASLCLTLHSSYQNIGAYPPNVYSKLLNRSVGSNQQRQYVKTFSVLASVNEARLPIGIADGVKRVAERD